jgi:hypothetical protein
MENISSAEIPEHIQLTITENFGLANEFENIQWERVCDLNYVDPVSTPLS